MFFSLQSSSTPKCQKDLCLGHDFNSFASYFLPRHLLEFVWQTCFTVDYLKLGIFYYLSFDHVRAIKASDTVVENHSKKSHFLRLTMRHFGVIFRHCVSAKIYASTQGPFVTGKSANLNSLALTLMPLLLPSSATHFFYTHFSS